MLPPRTIVVAICGLLAIAGTATTAVLPAAVARTAAAPSSWAAIQAMPDGYRFVSSSHDNDLTVRLTGRGLRFEDTSIEQLSSYPSSCRELTVADGAAAVCEVPDDVTAADPLEVELAVRRGDDRVDASSVPSSIRLSVLADAGADRIWTGAADDFVNGARGGDRVHAGAGEDWVRAGIGGDALAGGTGDDRLVGVDAADQLTGGPGDDQLGGGPGDDLLDGGPGHDLLRCSTGTDEAHIDADDTTSNCEVEVEELSARR